VAGHLGAVSLYVSRGWQEVGRFRPEWLPASEEPVRAMILPRRELARHRIPGTQQHLHEKGIWKA